VSDEPESIDHDEARNILNQEWNRILNDDEHDYLHEETLGQKISEVLHGSQLTYKYILVTNVLAKAVNPSIHYRAMQAQSNLSGAYNARSLGHQVLVEWEKDHGERLGGSNEPFLNKPARFPEFAMENAHQSASAHRRLYELLSGLEGKADSGDIDPMNVLRQTLDEISRLEPQTVDFESPSDAPFRELHELVEDYLEESGGGERLAAVTAGVTMAYYTHTGGDDWVVEAEHANVPDEFSNAAGDVEVFRDDELVRAIEVKDKPTERSDIQHATTKARESELGEYLYVVGAGFRTQTEKRGSMAEIESAPIEIVLVYPEDLLNLLKFIEDAGRISFMESVGEFLNAMRASEESKDGWKEVVEELSCDNS
jgi:hypothetical protein